MPLSPNGDRFQKLDFQLSWTGQEKKRRCSWNCCCEFCKQVEPGGIKKELISQMQDEATVVKVAVNCCEKIVTSDRTENKSKRQIQTKVRRPNIHQKMFV